jgi:hypothetical protein
MAIALTKRWRELTAEEAAKAPGQMGVYELGDDGGAVLYIGFAGGKSPFGLRSELQGHAAARTGGATRFRYEVNMQYTTRYKELLMEHLARHGELPPGNRVNPPVLGRLSPG